MRMPLSKVYRAFPELDRFSDSDCRRYVEAVYRDRRFESVLVVLVSIPLGVFGGLVGGLLTGFVVNTVGDRLYPESYQVVPGWLMLLGLLAGVSGTAFGGALLGFGPRDLWLRRRIKAHLNETRCSGCGYSLLGLSVRDNRVACPECGWTLDLAERNMTPDDLIATKEKAGGGDAPAR